MRTCSGAWELASEANDGTLTPQERSEYEAYVDAGDIMATLLAREQAAGERP